MPAIEVSNKLWNQFNAQRDRFDFPTNADFLSFCLETAKTRYCPAVGAIVTRDDREILMVGNDYGGTDLIWNLPGGAVDPGEDFIQAVTRELLEETGITALEIGPLAWIIQAVLQNDRPFIIGFAFNVTAWEGEVSLENEVEHGDVKQARFLPYDDAIECMIEGNKIALRDWLADPKDSARIYLSTPEYVQRIK